MGRVESLFPSCSHTFLHTCRQTRTLMAGPSECQCAQWTSKVQRKLLTTQSYSRDWDRSGELTSSSRQESGEIYILEPGPQLQQGRSLAQIWILTTCLGKQPFWTVFCFSNCFWKRNCHCIPEGGGKGLANFSIRK